MAIKARALLPKRFRRPANTVPLRDIPVDTRVDPPAFAHCDQRILHAPGECPFCDEYPVAQALRVQWGIAFSGQQPTDEQPLPCPADAAVAAGRRGDYNQWPGNRPEGYAGSFST